MERFTVDFYRADNGSCPVIEYLDSLSIKMRAKIMRTIALLESNGNMLGMPYSEHLGDGIFELRAKHGSDISRVLYFFYIEKRIIMTHGFTKKTNKVPQSEIERAKRYRSIFLNEQEGTDHV